MKRTAALFMCMMLSMLAFAQPPVPLLQEIYYTVKVQESKLSAVEEKWWSNNLETSAHYRFVGSILSSVKEGKVKVFRPEYPYKTPMSAGEIDNALFITDSMAIKTQGPGASKTGAVRTELGPAHIGSVGFYEHWLYDTTLAYTLQKKVKGIVLYRNVRGKDGSIKGTAPLFYVPFDQSYLATTPADLITSTITYETRIKNYDIWERDRSWWNENLEPSKRYALTNSIFYNALKGKLKVQNGEYPFEKPLKPQDVERITTIVDSVYVDDYLTGEMLLINDTTRITPYEMNTLRFHESWYFDPVKMAMHKEVKGFAILADRRSETGELSRGKYTSLFYLPLIKKEETKASIVNVPRIDMFQCIADQGCAEGADSVKWKKQMSLLLDEVKSQRKTARECMDPDPAHGPDPHKAKALTAARLNEVFTGLDAGALTGINITESWSFDPSTYRFTKSTIVIEPTKRNSSGVFGIAATETREPSADPEHLIGSDIEYQVEIARNALPQDDLLEYGPWWRHNLEISKRIGIVQQWLDDASSGKITVYSASDRSKALSPKEVKEQLLFYHTDWGENDIMYPDTVSIHEVPALRFHEAWYFDGAKGSFYKQVKGVTILMFGIDPNYRVRAFYIPLNT